MSGQVWTRAASTGGQAIVKQSDSQWLSPLSKLTVAWACSQLVVTRSEPNDFFTLSRSLFIVIFKYLFRRCPVASLSCLIAFCIRSLSAVPAAVSGICPSWILPTAQMSHKQTIKISISDNELNSSQKRYTRLLGGGRGMEWGYS